jgi:hypothetical protein
VTASRPKSIGEFSLNATAYLAGERESVAIAVVDYNFLSHPDDEKVILEGE